MEITFYDDPGVVLRVAGEFLESQPVFHNLILSLLHARVAYHEPGRFWVAAENNQVIGVVFQSPITIAAQLTPMPAAVVAAMVDAIAEAGVVLPGVGGEAATAASFAGQWTERCGSAAVPYEGMRLYELGQMEEGASVEGRLRRGVPEDRATIVRWVSAYNTETREHANNPETVASRWLSAGQVWLWECDQSAAVSMAVSRGPVAGVVRISGVYTPPEHRRRGYASACVRALSKRMRAAGYRCILYTDLGNPTSNSIYRRMGYKAVGEALRYRLE